MIERERDCMSLEEKIDKLIDEIGNIKVNLAEVKGTITSMERGLIAELKNHDHRIDALEKTHDKRIEKLETNQRWVVIAVIGYVVVQVLNLVVRL